MKIVTLSEAIELLQGNISEYDMTYVEGHNIIIFHKRDMEAIRYIVEVDGDIMEILASKTE